VKASTGVKFLPVMAKSSNRRMKNFLCIILAAVLLCGCSGLFTEHHSAQAGAIDQMSPEWLKGNIIVGKTTPAEVRTFFGQPVIKDFSPAAGVDRARLPDAMWIYSLRSKDSPGQGGKSIVFSFKNGTVSDYSVSGRSF